MSVAAPTAATVVRLTIAGPAVEPRPSWRPVLLTGTAAGAGAVAFLLAPPMGRDLSAQVARADFWARHGAAVLDFGWFGGFSPYGYSLLTPAPMAWLGAGVDGPKRLGALAVVAAAVVFALILRRTGARRPLLGGLLGTAGLLGNVAGGRITFTVGLLFGLLAVLALTVPHRGARWTATAVAAVLTSAASPVAGLFAGLAGTAVLLAAPLRRDPLRRDPLRRDPLRRDPLRRDPLRRAPRPGVGDGVVLATAAGVPMLVVGLLFGVDGPMNTLPSDVLRAATVSLVVALAVPRPVVRIGALLSAAGVVATTVVHTPVGLNAGRLSATFALGVLAAYAAMPSRRWLRVTALTCGLSLVAAWQHPIGVTEVRAAGDPMSDPARTRPLLAAIEASGGAGRVEVVQTDRYWEAAYLPQGVPIARGWLRQADSARHPVFFDGTLSVATYRNWLLDNGVAFVAVPAAPPSWPGRAEARIVRARPDYLRPVWRNDDWELFAVAGPTAVVHGASLVRSGRGGVVLDAPEPSDVLVRVRWSRWLTAAGPGACLTPGPDGWAMLRVTTPGRYTIGGSLRPSARCTLGPERQPGPAAERTTR